MIRGLGALDCEVLIWESGVRLQGNLEGSIPDPSTPIALNSRGEFLTRTYSPGEFAVWDSTGEYLRTVGRYGEGPGEIGGWPTIHVDPWDSVHVKDNRERWSVFSPDYSFKRVIQTGRRLTDPRYTLFHQSGVILVSNSPYRMRHVHLYDILDRVTGEVSGGFSLPAPEENHPRRILVSGRDSTFWSIPGHAYRAEEWTLTGRKVRTVERTADWFPARDDFVWSRDKGPPPSVITGLYYDQPEDLLWVRLMIPDPREWSPAGIPEGSLEAVRYVYDIVVEVLDLRNTKVLASLRTDGLEESIQGFLPDGRGLRLAEEESGIPSIEILNLRVAKRW